MADPMGMPPKFREQFRARAEHLAEEERLLGTKEAMFVAMHDGLTDTESESRNRLHRGAASLHAMAQRVHEEAAELHQRHADRLAIPGRVPADEQDDCVQLSQLSWCEQGGGASACTAEVDRPIRGLRVDIGDPRGRSIGLGQPIGAAPLVSWISFDGDTYWVRLDPAQGWPRTIRVAPADVEYATTV